MTVLQGAGALRQRRAAGVAGEDGAFSDRPAHALALRLAAVATAFAVAEAVARAVLAVRIRADLGDSV